MDFSLLGFSGLKEVYNLHPAFVHFPIALLPSALLFYFLGAVFKNASLSAAGRGCLYLACASGAVAAATGSMAEGSFPHNQTIHHIMQTHETIGYGAVVLSFVLGLWSFWQTDHQPKAAWAFFAALALAVLLVLQNGDLGGRMVFVEGAAVKPAAAAVTAAEAAGKAPEKKTPTGHSHEHGDHAH